MRGLAIIIGTLIVLAVIVSIDVLLFMNFGSYSNIHLDDLRRLGYLILNVVRSDSYSKYAYLESLNASLYNNFGFYIYNYGYVYISNDTYFNIIFVMGDGRVVDVYIPVSS